jgi:hypothetical protein
MSSVKLKNVFMYNVLRKAFVLLLFWSVFSPTVSAQMSNDSIMKMQTALRDDYIDKVKAMGFTPSLNPPPIVLDNPRSWGNYDDSANIIHTCDWKTLSPEQKAVFAAFANKAGNGMTAERFFQLAVYRWIFVHEISHWWRACQHQTAEPYENEKAANRLASAYWRGRDPSFYSFMLSVFKSVVENSPSPVPPGEPKEKYLNDNYQKLPGGQAYSWYQSIMIIEVSEELPPATFEQAVQNSGK